MPIYAYKCDACGHAKDVLQKISDPLLSVCPVCGAAAFTKQLTAAGFQLKGSGWYVTDFKNGNVNGPASKPADSDKPADAAAAAPQPGAAGAAPAAAGTTAAVSPTPVATAPPASAAAGSPAASPAKSS
ncbi:MAG: zinc ribbon domain-containing protein [Polaromonas sp.]|nr:zinc ribbon domain-containing protein [Polaromonas sp.]